MKNLLLKTGVLLVAAACISESHAAPLTVATEKVVMLVNESITPNGVVSTTARSGPLTTAGSVFSIDRFGSANVAVPIALPPVPTAGYFGTTTGLPTSGDIANLANNHLRAQYPALKSALSAHMRKYGITSGWFNFKQQVNLNVNDAQETWTIYWDFFTDTNGRGAFGEAKIVPAEPNTLYVVYTPLRVSSDLPANWSFDGAGTLKYQLRDAQFQPVSSWVTVNVGGAFDSIEAPTEGYDAGLACLMDTSKAGCTPSLNDVKNLMDRTGAVLSVVDYVRRVEPDYQDQPDGTRTPKMTAALSTRELTYTGCTPPVFRNVGNLSYTLATTVARYLAGSVGFPRTVEFEQIQEFKGTYLSPGLPFDLSLQVPRRDTAGISAMAIDPVQKDRLMALADIPGLQYPVSAIQINGDPAATIGSTTGITWQYGGRDDAYQMNWQLKCAQYDDGYELSTTINSTEDWNGWHPNTPAKSLVSSAGWSPVAVNGFGPSRYQAYADYAAGIVRLQEGATAGSYSYRSSGGGEGGTWGFICAHNNYSMMAPNGVAYECNAPTPISYSCGALSRPYDHYVDGAYRGHVTQAYCTGHQLIRGLYMSNGAPYYEYQELSRVDRSPEAQYNCRDGACAWEVRDGTEPQPAPPQLPPAPPQPEPSCTPGYGSPSRGVTGYCTNCDEVSWVDSTFSANKTAEQRACFTHFNSQDNPDPDPAPVPAPTPAPSEPLPQLPPSPAPATCPWAGQVAGEHCEFTAWGGGSDCIEGEWAWSRSVYVASDPTCATTEIIDSGSGSGYLDGCPGRSGTRCPDSYGR